MGEHYCQECMGNCERIEAAYRRGLKASDDMRRVELEQASRETQKWNNRANQLAIEVQELRQKLAQAAN